MTARQILRRGAAATLALILSATLFSCFVHVRAVSGESGRGCLASELKALISLKKSFVDPTGRLSSWRILLRMERSSVRQPDRHVVKLDLRGPEHTPQDINFRGQINSTSVIAGLPHLRYLDLSYNILNDSTRKPLSFLGTLKQLRYLNLSNACFLGGIPSQLGNLSRLHYLDLSDLYFQSVSDLAWLPHLSLLRFLDLSFLKISSARNWLLEVNKLPNLKALYLRYCFLNGTVSTLSHSNLTQLEILDLSYNSFNSLVQRNWFWDLNSIKKLILNDCGWSGPIPGALGNMSSLEVLYLDQNFISGIVPVTLKNLCNLQLLNLEQNNINGDVVGRLQQCSWSMLRELHLQSANLVGQLPVWIGNMTSLTFLDLSRNMLVGPIPHGIGNMKSLSYLDLSRNMLIGDVPDGIGSLSNLTYLGLGLNKFSGVLSEGTLASLAKLEYLNLSQNSLKLDFAKDWIPPFRLTSAHLGSCDIGPQFPTWLRWQTGIRDLDISDTRINDVLPHWFWVVFANVSSMDLSRNNSPVLYQQIWSYHS